MNKKTIMAKLEEVDFQRKVDLLKYRVDLN